MILYKYDTLIVCSARLCTWRSQASLGRAGGSDITIEGDCCSVV